MMNTWIKTLEIFLLFGTKSWNVQAEEEQVVFGLKRNVKTSNPFIITVFTWKEIPRFREFKKYQR